MEEAKTLFNQYLNPANSNPDEAGSLLLEILCSNVHLLFEIIQNDQNLRDPAIVFLKRVLDLKFIELTHTEKNEVFSFLTMILIPIIIPENPIYLSPIIAEIFYFVTHEMGVDKDALNSFLKGLTNPEMLSFIILVLNRLDPSFLELDFTSNVMSIGLNSNDPRLFVLCFRLFVVLCNNFPSSPVFHVFIERFINLTVELLSPDVWNILSDFTKPLSVPFMKPALSVLSNTDLDFNLRVSAFNFLVGNLDEDCLPNLPQFMHFLVEFQLTNLDEIDCIDPSLFFLYQISLENPSIRNQAFEIYRNATFQLLSLNSIRHQVVGLYSLAFLIDNAPEMSLLEYIPNDLSLFHSFFITGHAILIEAVFEVLKIMIGKPLSSHFNFEVIFNDVIELFLNADDNIRNRAAIFAYKYLKSHFVVNFWMFHRFFQVLHLVKYTELPIYLEILADSILPNSLTVSDNEIDSLATIATDILKSNRDLDVKIPAASLCFSLIQKDAELTFKIAEIAVKNAFLALKQTGRMMRKTMSVCLIRFIKCTSGLFIPQLRYFYNDLLQCSIIQNELSPFGEPLLYTEIIRYDSQIPSEYKDGFLNLLISTIQNQTSVKQYKIACLCLKKIINRFPLNLQLQITMQICNSVNSPNFFKLIRFGLHLLSSMLKVRLPYQNRLEIAQVVAQILHPYPDSVLKTYIGSLCMICSLVIRTIGSKSPESLIMFCHQLFEKTMESPVFYSHYTFFLFSDCIKYSVIDDETSESVLNAAFNQLKGDFTNFDASCSLLCIKAALEKNPDSKETLFTEERMSILIESWMKMASDYTMLLSRPYLASIFIKIGFQNLIPPPIFKSALEAFPTEIKSITGEICQILLENVQSFPVQSPEIILEIFKGTLRLLSAGKSIRYTHKITADTVVEMIKLALMIATSMNLDVPEILMECFPSSQRKRDIILGFFQQVQSAQ